MAGIKAKAFRPGCGPSRAARLTGRHRSGGARRGQAKATVGPGGLASGLWARAGRDWRGCGLARKGGFMGRGKICTVDGFAYSPHSNMQGRAGESSPALLCLCFPLNAFDFFDGKSNPTTKVVCGQFPGVPPAAESHRGNFPTGGKLGRREEFGSGVMFHGTTNVRSFHLMSH